MITYYVNYNCLRKQLALVCVLQVSYQLIVTLINENFNWRRYTAVVGNDGFGGP